jgi:repressor LexA
MRISIYAMKEESAYLVRELLKLPGMTQQKLADEIGIEIGDGVTVSQPTVSRWLNGAIPETENWEAIKRVALRRLNGAAHNLGSHNPLKHVKEVPVRGYVGAGAEVFKIAYETGVDDVETVEVPVGFGSVEALKVRGDSMFPAYRDGDIICVAEFDGNVNELIGKECLVITADDRWLLKTIERGSMPERYHLFSHNAPMMRDVQISEATPVKYVVKH